MFGRTMSPTSDAAPIDSHSLEYLIRDLPTRSVTLSPSRAQVIRDIKDIPLKVSPSSFLIPNATVTTLSHHVRAQTDSSFSHPL